MLNKDFFPTPPSLISKMIGDIDFSKVVHVLEPSAGKGDICDRIKARINDRDARIDTIEIDEDLQFILRGKGYNVIADDFLKFNTLKRYDLIVANFPFSEGEAHLRKALSMIESGGNLVCLVNAETILNKCNNLRVEISSILEDNNASIEFLEGEFKEAERKTNVDVALIRVSIEDKGSRILLDDMIKAKGIDEQYSKNDNIIDGDPIKALVSRFNFEASLGERIIEEYFSLVPFIMNDIKDEYKSPILKLAVKDDRYSTNSKSELINSYIAELRRKYWKLLIRNEKFNAYFTSNLLSDLEKKLEELKGYDFTEFNISSLQKELSSKVSMSVEATIVKLFDELSYQNSYSDEFKHNIHYFNGWCTNKAHFINKKVIIPFYAFRDWCGDYRFDRYEAERKLTDIVKSLNYLADEISNINYSVTRALDKAEHGHDYTNIDFHYFTATFYKKGTCHIRFSNQELLDKFNIFGCQRKGWLPPAYGKKRYSEMNDQEKAVVTEFQGEARYSEIMERKDEFIFDVAKQKFLI